MNRVWLERRQPLKHRGRTVGPGCLHDCVFIPFQNVILPLDSAAKALIEERTSTALGENDEQIHPTIVGDRAIHRAKVLNRVGNHHGNTARRRSKRRVGFAERDGVRLLLLQLDSFQELYRVRTVRWAEPDYSLSEAILYGRCPTANETSRLKAIEDRPPRHPRHPCDCARPQILLSSSQSHFSEPHLLRHYFRGHLCGSFRIRESNST